MTSQTLTTDQVIDIAEGRATTEDVRVLLYSHIFADMPTIPPGMELEAINYVKSVVHGHFPWAFYSELTTPEGPHYLPDCSAGWRNHLAVLELAEML